MGARLGNNLHRTYTLDNEGFQSGTRERKPSGAIGLTICFFMATQESHDS
jgi:hypothetical protein